MERNHLFIYLLDYWIRITSLDSSVSEPPKSLGDLEKQPKNQESLWTVFGGTYLKSSETFASISSFRQPLAYIALHPRLTQTSKDAPSLRAGLCPEAVFDKVLPHAIFIWHLHTAQGLYQN